MKLNFYLVLFLVLSASCTRRSIVYLNDLPEDARYTEAIRNVLEPRIEPMDVISITVSTLNPESNVLFNSGVMSSLGSQAAGGGTTTTQEGYRVDKYGDINFPVLGKVNLAGLTLEEATDKMTALLENEARNPIVNIRLLNFKITVIGEVRSPSTIPILTERINILEAIGLAGDLTVFGRRENVLLLREIEGERVAVRLDLTQKALLSSPYFYLKQNDVLYVEPVPAAGQQATMWRQNLQLGLGMVNIVLFIIITTRQL